MFAAKEWRMKIQTEQNKPHKTWTSISQEFTVSFTINNIRCYNSLHRNNLNACDMNLNLPSGYGCI